MSPVLIHQTSPCSYFCWRLMKRISNCHWMFSGMEGLTKRMSTVKEIIGQQIDAVKRRQEDAMKAQEKLKEQMDTVGLDVESTRTNVEEVCILKICHWTYNSCIHDHSRAVVKHLLLKVITVRCNLTLGAGSLPGTWWVDALLHACDLQTFVVMIYQKLQNKEPLCTILYMGDSFCKLPVDCILPTDYACPWKTVTFVRQQIHVQHEWRHACFIHCLWMCV